ncbi:DUF4352 domain-containing protein [Paenibacillus sp. LMG 31458]|uniref:DUF4352 domain-containing protein n=2 Tax=Paenibacillus phytorum TaxID=2654977 RepID=A0ABX1Y3Z7_9BACL|nr:DUF4352 domain-containing protein [Paenibacillus phytorum]
MIFVSWKGLKGAGKTFGIIWAVIGALIVIGNLNKDDSISTKTASAPVVADQKNEVKAETKKEEPKASPKATPAPTPVELSKEGVSSDVKITVISTETKAEIGDNQILKAKAQGVFKVIELTVANNQKDAIILDSNSFKLIDDQNREFSSSTEAEHVAFGPDKTILLKKLNPGLSITGLLAFDVPKDAKGFYLQAQGGMLGKKIKLKVE